MEHYWLSPGEGKLLPNIGTLKASAARTSGSFELIEYSGLAAPPPHVHRMREEAFFILEGSFSFVLAKEDIEASRPWVTFAPRTGARDPGYP